jgi:tetratricopeptide (TPR) repeat protein
VAEPFLDATIRPDILFPAYLSGFTLAEAYYLAMPYLSWQTVVVGDPLCAVATMKRPDETSLAPPLDPATETPRFYSRRRVEAEEAGAPKAMDISREALQLAVLAESRFARDDRAGAEQALLKATELAPRFLSGQLLLANLHEERKEYEAASKRYRAVLDVDGDNIIALNNLAYNLAVREKKPGDALPLAQRAYTLSRGSGVIADTLAWVHHLLGNDAEAARYVQEALKGAADNADVQLHAAVVLAEGGQVDAAKKALARAVELDPKVAEREEAKALRAKLK